MNRFAGKTILVTGGSSGIGAACARQLSSEGARLVLVGRNQEALKAAADSSAGLVLACDLAEEASIRAVVASLKQQAVGLDGFVLAAGTHDLRPLLMETQANLASLLQLNVHGPLLLLGQALRARLVRPGASIVLFSSAAARAGGAALVGYAASKGAMEAAVRSLAVELSGQRVRVNAVAPGIVQTPMTEKYFSKLTAEQQAHLRGRHLLGLGRPEDVAGAVCFLVSEEARWITGSIMAVDGGFGVG